MNVFTLSSSSKQDQTVLPRVTAALIQETDSKAEGWSGHGDTSLVCPRVGAAGTAAGGSGSRLADTGLCRTLAAL